MTKAACTLAAGALSLSILTLSGPAHAQAGDPWCRLDDPAYTETERTRLGLSQRELDTVACPKVVPGTDLPEELVLPMPCGRHMVFRRISLRADNLLDHTTGQFGRPLPAQQEERDRVVNGPWTGTIAGAFTNPAAEGRKEGIERVYYIGKYEVTDVQFRLLRDGAFNGTPATADATQQSCAGVQAAAAAARGTRSLPAVRVTWADAVAFADAYTEWLIRFDDGRLKADANAKPHLPWAGGSPGYIRLPTEAEWEFASRAGLVGDADRAKRFYEVIGEDGQRRTATLAEIAFTRSADQTPPEGSQVDYVGRRMPNLFGLYDMVGNADEIVLDLFRMTRPDGLHGQVGGYIVKGGNAQDPPTAIHVAARREVPLYQRQGAVRSPLTGFRLVIAAPFFVNDRIGWEPAPTNAALDAEIKAAMRSLLDITHLPGAADRARAQAELEELKKANDTQRLDTEVLRQRLASIEASLQSRDAALTERDRRLLEERLRSAMLTAMNIRDIRRQIQSVQAPIERAVKRIEETTNEEVRRLLTEELTFLRRRTDVLERAIQANFRYYIETLVDIAATEPGRITSASESIQQNLRVQGLEVFKSTHELTMRHLNETRSASRTVSEIMQDSWLKQIYEVRRE